MVRLDTVGVEEGFLPPGSKVPSRAPGSDGEVPPAIGDVELAQVEIRHDLVPGDERVREAVIAVTDDEILGCGPADHRLRVGLLRGQVLVLGMQIRVAID